LSGVCPSPVCVSAPVAGLSSRDLFFLPNVSRVLCNSESYYSSAKGFVLKLNSSFFRVFWRSSRTWISARRRRKDRECLWKPCLRGPCCSTLSASLSEPSLLPQLLTRWQEARMDGSVLDLDSAKLDFLAQSKCQQAVFLSVEGNWPQEKKKAGVPMRADCVPVAWGCVSSSPRLGWPFNPCRVSGRTGRGGWVWWSPGDSPEIARLRRGPAAPPGLLRAWREAVAEPQETPPCSGVTLFSAFRIVSTQLPPPLTAKVLLQGDESAGQVCC